MTGRENSLWSRWSVAQRNVQLLGIVDCDSEVYLPCMSPRNHADCVAILIVTSAACRHSSG